MNPTAAGYLYLIAAVLFVVGLKRLSSPATAKDGNRIAALGMLVAIVVTLLDQEVVGYGLVATGLVVGGAVGVVLAQRVEMTS
ncbi:MAG: NAD(P)(+) transhydrogenase (Re/Si-specific) subunit beta, partial [Ilumatobacteraceae bacterium]